jgi:pimeloyl-ACP methyl ester carboxylesterase
MSTKQTIRRAPAIPAPCLRSRKAAISAVLRGGSATTSQVAVPRRGLVPGMGDLRAGYRFLAPGLRAAGYRVACADFRGHGDSDATFTSYGDDETAGDVIALIGEPGGPAVVVGNSIHDPAEARLADVTAPALVVMGEQDPDFPDPRAEADWIARALHAHVVMVPEAGRCPQSQRPGIATGAVLRFPESVTGRA